MRLQLQRKSMPYVHLLCFTGFSQPASNSGPPDPLLPAELFKNVTTRIISKAKLRWTGIKRNNLKRKINAVKNKMVNAKGWDEMWAFI